MKVTVLIDNRSSDASRFACEHGLSFWVQKGEHNLVFDAGASDGAFANAAELDIDISGADWAVCSHGHYDHGCGFYEPIRAGRIKRLVTGPGFLAPKYSVGSDGEIKYAGTGITGELLRESGTEHLICDDLLELAPGIWAVGGFLRSHSFEVVSPRFLLEEGDCYVADHFDEEIALVVQNDLDDGVTVVVGCSHPGILNMLSTIGKKLGRPISAVIGGTHLMEADQPRIDATLTELKAMNIKKLGLCHCSGEYTLEYIKNDPDINGFYAAAGDSVTF